MAGTASLSGHNRSVGWAAFRALRQKPGPAHAPRHRNCRHGMRSREGQAIMRQLRFADWLLRKPGRLMAVPDEALGVWCRPRPLGWAAYGSGKLKNN